MTRHATPRRSRSLLALLFEPTGGWKRQVLFLALGLVAAGGFAAARSNKPDTAELVAHPIAVEARQIAAFDRVDGSRTRFGNLEWRSGLVLTSTSEHFGGWSGLEIAPDGRSFVAISDAGTWLSGEFAYEGRVLKGIENTQLGPLKKIDGTNLLQQRYRDAESIALEQGTLDNGTALVSFEQYQRIGRFPVSKDGLGPPREYLKFPPDSRGKDGIEAVAVLKGGPAKGAVVAINEINRDDDISRGWIWIGGEPRRFFIRGAAGFNVTDAKSLDDGTLLLLERRFRWTEGVRMRLSRVEASALKPDSTADRRVLATADMGQEIDNMEGMALSTNPRGEIIVTMISDDNFNPVLQRTVLLQFALVPDDPGQKSSAAGKAAEPR